MGYRNRTRTFEGSAFELWQAGHWVEAMARDRDVFMDMGPAHREPLIPYTGTDFDRDYEAAYQMCKRMGFGQLKEWDNERREQALRKEARELWRAGKRAEAYALDHCVQYSCPPSRPEDWYELTPNELRRAKAYRESRRLEMATNPWATYDIDYYTKWYAENTERRAIYGPVPSAEAIAEYNRLLAFPGHDPITDSAEIRHAGMYLLHKRFIAELKPIDD